MKRFLIFLVAIAAIATSGFGFSQKASLRASGPARIVTTVNPWKSMVYYNLEAYNNRTDMPWGYPFAMIIARYSNGVTNEIWCETLYQKPIAKKEGWIYKSDAQVNEIFINLYTYWEGNFCTCKLYW